MIAITPGAEGQIETLLREENPEEAKQAAGRFLQIFGHDNFYVSIQRLSIADEEKGNEAIIQLARFRDKDCRDESSLLFERKRCTRS